MNTTPQAQTSPNLRWPKAGEGIVIGVVVLGAISVLCILLQWLYPQANRNPWFVIQASDDLISPSLVAVFTTHFFHGSNEHLWGNLLFLWPIGLLAFAIAGPYRGMSAIGYGILFAGLAQLKGGVDGTFYMGSSSIVFAMLGIIILASIRRGILLTLLMVVGIGFLGDAFFDTIRPTALTAAVGISWLGHLGGLIGGFNADLNDPIEAVRVLHKKELVDDFQTENLLKAIAPESYSDINVTSEKTAPPPDQSL